MIAALFLVVSVRSVKANCGCRTSTPIPTPAPTPIVSPTPLPIPTPTPNMTSQPTPVPSNVGLSPAGAPICTANQPPAPLIKSIVRRSTNAILTWTPVTPVSYYFIFYGTKPGSQQFGIPNVGNVTTFTVGALNPRLKYYFDVRAVNDCMPSGSSTNSGQGQVLGASTTVLAATGSDLILPRLFFGILTGGVTFFLAKKFSF